MAKYNTLKVGTANKASPTHIGTTNNNEYLYDSLTYFCKVGISLTLNASEEAGKIVVATEIEIIKGKRAIGSEDEKAERNALIRQYITADQMSDSAIGRAMNLNESTIRSIRKKLDDDEKKGISQTAEVLKESLANSEYGMVDVGKGSELYIGVSQTRMTNALAILKEQGYVVQTHKVNQPFSGNQTTLHILTKEDKEWKDVKNNLDKLTPLGQF